MRGWGEVRGFGDRVDVGSLGFRGAILFLTEAKQKGTVHRSVPQGTNFIKRNGIKDFEVIYYSA